MKKTLLIYFFRALAMTLGFCTIFAAWDVKYWFFELFAHFAVQYIMLSAVMLPMAIYMHRWRMTTILVLVMAINCFELWQIATHYSQEKEQCNGQTISILQSNVYYRNMNINEAAKTLQKAAERADIVIFNEFAEEWREREEGRFKSLFPHGFVTWISSNIEKMAIFSRQPFHVQQRSGFVEKNAHLRLIFPTLGLTLFTYHGFTPMNAYWVQERDREMLRIAKELRRMHSPGLLTGGFNQTPYATRFQQMLFEGDLRLAPFPQGVLPTWPDGWFTAPLEIPLDHMLVNKHVRVCSREVINIPGSDHSAILNTLQLLPSVPNYGEN